MNKKLYVLTCVNEDAVIAGAPRLFDTFEKAFEEMKRDARKEEETLAEDGYGVQLKLDERVAVLLYGSGYFYRYEINEAV